MNPNYSTAVSQMRQSALQQKQHQEAEAKRNKDLSELKVSMKAVGNTVASAIERKSNKVVVTNFPTSISTPDVQQLVSEIQTLRDEMYDKDIEDKTAHALLNDLLVAVKNLPTDHQDINIPEAPKEMAVSNLKDYTDKLNEVVSAVKAIEMNFYPEITVKASDVHVENDYSSLETKLDVLTKAVKAISIVIPEKDDSKVMGGLKKVTDAITGLRFPVANYILPYKDADGLATQAQINSQGSVVTEDELTTSRYDIQGNIIYTARAVPFSNESDAVWTITKYDLSDLSNAYGKIVTDAPWVNRVTQTYV